MPTRNYPTLTPTASDHDDLIEAMADINQVIERHRADISMSTLCLLTDALREINLADRYLAGAR